MDTIDRSQIVVCPHCDARVVLTPIMICPSCRIIIQEGGQLDETNARLIDDYTERPSEIEDLDEDVLLEESGDPEPGALYDAYRNEALRIGRLWQGTIIFYSTVGLAFLAAALSQAQNAYLWAK